MTNDLSDAEIAVLREAPDDWGAMDTRIIVGRGSTARLRTAGLIEIETMPVKSPGYVETRWRITNAGRRVLGRQF